MSKITFLGAAGTVTGSCFLLSDDDGRGIIIDMGMFQGKPEIGELNYNPFKFDIEKIQGVVLTHAHLDHCGRLPLLLRMGFKGRIYMTEPTRVLTELTLLDAAKIQEEHSGAHLPMYDENDVRLILRQMELIEYEKQFDLGRFRITMRDAGHILGSGIVEVEDNWGSPTNKHLVFSGDLGNSPEDLVRPTEYIKKADVVVMESTYGDRTHQEEDAQTVLKQEINAVEDNSAVLLIPAFSVERAQEILHIIDHLKKSGEVKEDTQVFLDSPMAIRATEIYRQFKNLYGKELKEHVKNDDPFDFPGLHMVETGKESFKIHQKQGTKVIIAGSGMMTGGRILNHAIEYLPHAENRLLIVGFQGEGTIGRAILNGERQVQMYERRVTVNASVRKSSGMSAHADQPKLLKWLKAINGVEKLILVHGEDVSRQAFKELVSSQTNIKDIYLPQLNDIIDLP